MRHFTLELDELRKLLLQMGGAVESAVHRSVRSLMDRDEAVARRVLEAEASINQMEIDIDRMATRLLVLQQPMARDLRFLTSVLKINADLERMAEADAPKVGIDKESLIKFYATSDAIKDRILSEKLHVFLKEHSKITEKVTEDPIE